MHSVRKPAAGLAEATCRAHTPSAARIAAPSRVSNHPLTGLMRISRTLHTAALVVAAVALSSRVAAAAPAGSAPAGSPVEVARLTCTALVRAGSLTCVPMGTAVGAVALSAGFGRADGGSWVADLAVQNLSAATLGAAEGGAPGVSVEVAGPPETTLGSGTVTAPGAWRYEGVVAPGATSALRPWAFGVPASVEAFTFTAAVVATVSYPRGAFAIAPERVLATPGGTTTVSASARTRTGMPVPAGFVQFSSSNPAVATVAADGTVTGVAPGVASVTGAMPEGSGAATVCIDPGLAVGGVYHFTLTSGQALCLQGGTSGNAEYTIIPQNQTASQQTITLTGSGIVAVTGPPTPLTGDSPDGLTDGRPVELGVDGTAVYRDPALGDVAAGDRAELERIERDYTETNALLTRAGARITAANREAADGGASNAIPAGVPTVGQLWTLNVAQGCSGAVDNRVGRVLHLSQHFIVVEDTLRPAGGGMPQINNGTYYTADSLAAQAERWAWQGVTGGFGQPADVDGNGRVVLFFTRAVNELTPPASSAINHGYYTSRDLFSNDPVNGCQRSNQGEIIYLAVPDPTGSINSNVRTMASVVGVNTRTIGRELSRLINGSRRMYVTEASFFEEPWLETGLANVAEELMFYRASFGLQPRQNIILSNLTTGPLASRRVAAFNTFANLNYTRWRGLITRSDTAGVYAMNGNPTSTGTGGGLTGQGGNTWSFLRYAVDRHVAAGGTESAFWNALVGTTPGSSRQGLDNLRNALGLATEADVLRWISDWTVATYGDDTTLPVAGEYQHRSWNYRSLYAQLGGVPITPRYISNDVGLTLAYRRKGGYTYARAGVPSGSFATFTATGPFNAPLPFSVIRTK